MSKKIKYLKDKILNQKEQKKFIGKTILILDKLVDIIDANININIKFAQ